MPVYGLIWPSLLVALLLIGTPRSGSAACAGKDFAAVVDKSGAALRAFNAEALPKLQEKLKQLKIKKGWNDADYKQKALYSVRDERTAKLDAEAEDLILKIDALGGPTKGAADCAKLTQLETAGTELLAVMKAKSDHTLGKLDAAIAGKKTTKGASGPKAEKALPKSIANSAAQKWATQPNPEASAKPPVVTLEPGPSFAMLETLPPDQAGYTIDEIRDISRGFFGTISTELGSVIEYAFSRAGRPDGYVLGTEGGGAFLAGVRYGSGTLYLHTGGSEKVFWHGPSIGYDFGGEGSRTMFLIYRLGGAPALYRTFTGIDGSAYFIGGVGITFLKGGPVLMAPIRTGLGFRLGANIGYIRFTPRPTWNPF